jgi:hypothetical protein
MTQPFPMPANVLALRRRHYAVYARPRKNEGYPGRRSRVPLPRDRSLVPAQHKRLDRQQQRLDPQQKRVHDADRINGMENETP